MTILVFGSVNMDLTTYGARLPHKGETLFGTTYQISPGGKGANQAVGAARLGAPTAFVGRVGDDDFGAQALSILSTNSVDTTAVLKDPKQETGLAVISVDEQGDNTIVVISGANMALDQQDIERALPALAEAKVLLLQLEVPLEANLQLASAARQQGVRVMLDPAPVKPLDEKTLAAIDILTPNEKEAEALVGFPVDSLASAKRAAQNLFARGVSTVIIKLAERGAYFQSASDSGHVPAFEVEVLDTVAAGDAFNAGLAVALGEGLSLAEAVRWGAAVGALATTIKGASAAMPTRKQVLTLLESAPSR